jgi:phosphonate transport system ATP-binding protein
MNLLRQLSLETGKTLITSLHAFEYARSHFERIIGLRQGYIFFDVPAKAVSMEMVEELYKT